MTSYKSPYSGERRKHTRTPVKFLLLIDISPNFDPNVVFEGNVLNISEGGVLIQLSDFQISKYVKPLEEMPLSSTETISQKLKDYKVWLNFILPDQDDRIKALSRIVRAEENYCLAMQFLEISDESRKLIRDYIESEKETE